jgi:hypothetical protein
MIFPPLVESLGFGSRDCLSQVTTSHAVDAVTAVSDGIQRVRGFVQLKRSKSIWRTIGLEPSTSQTGPANIMHHGRIGSWPVLKGLPATSRSRRLIEHTVAGEKRN